MKKSKEKSKPKKKINTQGHKGNSLDIQQKKIVCGVCRCQFKKEHTFMTCECCQRKVHSSCYNKDLSEAISKSNKPFKCDMCTYGKAVQYCSICYLRGEDEVLRQIKSSTLETKFVHIECALLASSNVVQIQSFSKMTLYEVSPAELNKSTCDFCGKVRQGNFVHCVACKVKGHYQCTIPLRQECQEEYYMISRWLEKCEKYEFLLTYLCNKRPQLKALIESLPPKLEEGRLLVCPKHDKYTFCYCNDDKNQDSGYFSCDMCKRWVHHCCSGLSPNTQKDFYCEGCLNNDILKKQLQPNQLLDEICRLQKVKQCFDEEDMRLLNSFPFKYSKALQKNIDNFIKQIQLYFVKRQITKLCKQEQISDKNLKKITSLVFLTVGSGSKKQDIEILKNSEKLQSNVMEILKSKKIKYDPVVQVKLMGLFLNSKKKNAQFEEFKEGLKNFLKQWTLKNQNKGAKGSYDELAYFISELQDKFIKAFENNPQDQKKIIDKFATIMGSEIFKTLISKKISVSLIKILLRSYSKIRFYQNNKKEVSEEIYLSLVQHHPLKLTHQEQQAWQEGVSIINKMANSLKVVFEGEKKQKAYQKIQNFCCENIGNSSVHTKAHHQLLSECIVSAPMGILSQSWVKQMQQIILKRKILRMCSIPQESLKQQNFRDLNRITEYTKKNIQFLNKQELDIIKSYLGRLQFFQIILRKGQCLQQYAIVESQKNENSKESVGVVVLKFLHILDNWDERILSSQYVINQLWKCVTKRAKFQNSAVYQKIKNLLGVISYRIAVNMEEGRFIMSGLLRKTIKVLKIFELGKQFPQLFRLYQKYKKWANIFYLEEIPSNISFLLQKPQKSVNLIKIIENKLSTILQLQKINVGIQMSKLCLLRQWCRLSQKISFLFKSKGTINAIQNLKNLLDKCMYPLNSLHRKVVELENESKILNKQVFKFLQKPKLSQHSSFFEQLKFISNKLTINQGLAIKNLLERCNLDVFVQSQELQNQIMEFEMISRTSIQVDTNNASQLIATRKKFIQSCFRIQKIDDYQGFLRKIYINRCLKFEPPITKAEYYQLLSVGGTFALSLQQKTADLLKTYKLIEKAQAEMANPRARHRNLNFLIPWIETKHRQIKQALKYDPIELKRFEKAKFINNRIRQEYYQLRSRKTQLERFQNIQIELTYSIFNNRDIISEINGLKNDLLQLVKRVEEIMPYSSPTMQIQLEDNHLEKQRSGSILDLYNSLKIRHSALEKFDYDCKLFWKADQLKNCISLDSYKGYTDICQKMSQLASKIPKFMSSRKQIFLLIFKHALQSEKPSIIILKTLISEGLELRRLDPIKNQAIFDNVIKVYQKLRQVEKLIESDKNEEEEEEDFEVKDRKNGEIQDEDDDDDMGNQDDIDEEDDEDIEDGIDDQFDDDLDESDESDLNDNDEDDEQNNQIVLDSD